MVQVATPFQILDTTPSFNNIKQKDLYLKLSSGDLILSGVISMLIV